jgi:hypothetical protein
VASESAQNTWSRTVSSAIAAAVALRGRCRPAAATC